MTKMNGSQAIVEELKREKVKNVFGIPGGATIDFYDVLYDSELRYITTRHEQCAAHMADGYARVSGLSGVCTATSGPGATNLVTGIATAYMDSSPIIAFTGQVNSQSANSSYMIGRDAFQEADIVGITTPITKYNYQVKEASELPTVVKEAFHIASTGRPGPVLIDLPKNVQSGTAEMDFSSPVKLRGYNPTYNPHPIQVKRAVELLVNAERPVMLAGGGVILSNASQECVRLAEFTLMPISTTLMGKGAISENHPLALGSVGMHGTIEANKLILEADVLLTVGARFSDRTTGALSDFCPDSKIIHIDIDTAEIGKNLRVELPIVADAKKALKEVYRQVTHKMAKKEKSPWFERIQRFKEQYKDLMVSDRGLKPPKLMVELRKLLPQNAIVATEVGQCQMWAALYLKALEPRTFITSGGLGTMGFGFPAALGAKVARPDVPVVDVAGDGSFRMTEQELATSVVEDIPVIVIILNNSMLGMVAQWQRLFYGRRYAGTELKDSPDFVKLAKAYGANGVRVGSLEEFVNAVKMGLRSDVTTVIDVPIASDEDVWPMVPAGAGLGDMIWVAPEEKAVKATPVPTG
jgi:acetolactate synthase-1/2/3 large subunit